MRNSAVPMALPLIFGGARVAIVGATSGIGRAVAMELSSRRVNLHLAARDAEELERVACDLQVRFGNLVSWSRFDLQDRGSHADLLASSRGSAVLDGVVFCVGQLGEQGDAERDPAAAAELLDINFVSAVHLLTLFANELEERGRGFLVGVSSVAGDRGRAANYAYGSAKGGFSLFLQGLRARLYKKGIHVMTVKPGFVDTKMTFGRPGMFLVSDADVVARDVVRGLERVQDVLYTPWFWSPIMTVVRAIPERVFKRLNV